MPSGKILSELYEKQKNFELKKNWSFLEFFLLLNFIVNWRVWEKQILIDILTKEVGLMAKCSFSYLYQSSSLFSLKFLLKFINLGIKFLLFYQGSFHFLFINLNHFITLYDRLQLLRTDRDGSFWLARA